jgi:predicted Holliday junction resolvase-like endonuclease
MSEQMGMLFFVLFVVAAALCVYLSISMSRRVQAGINLWCENDKKNLETQLRQIAYGEAGVELERWRQENEQTIRLDAIQRSLAVTKGKVTDHIVPYLPGFDLDPKDVRFLGTPIDLIAFGGLNASEEVEIEFIGMKTGQSALSTETLVRGPRLKDADQSSPASIVDICRRPRPARFLMRPCR